MSRNFFFFKCNWFINNEWLFCKMLPRNCIHFSTVWFIFHSSCCSDYNFHWFSLLTHSGSEKDHWLCESDLCHNVSHLPPEDQLPPGFPTIDMGPQLKVVERTRTATMLCAASGNPDPDISWFKDFLPVNTTNNNGRIKQLRSGRLPLLKT